MQHRNKKLNKSKKHGKDPYKKENKELKKYIKREKKFRLYMDKILKKVEKD